jgi:hypothetical protein
MDLIADRGRRVPVEELNTSRLLAHARKQAVKRKLDDMLIVDVDASSFPTWKTTSAGSSPWPRWARADAAA